MWRAMQRDCISECHWVAVITDANILREKAGQGCRNGGVGMLWTTSHGFMGRRVCPGCGGQRVMDSCGDESGGVVVLYIKACRLQQYTCWYFWNRICPAHDVTCRETMHHVIVWPKKKYINKLRIDVMTDTWHWRHIYKESSTVCICFRVPSIYLGVHMGRSDVVKRR